LRSYENKAIIVVTGLAKAMWALQRINPAVIRWMMGRDLKKAHKERLHLHPPLLLSHLQNRRDHVTPM
jgi:hypothetical protein